MKLSAAASRFWKVSSTKANLSSIICAARSRSRARLKADLRSALTEIDGRAHAATQNLEAEKARLQAALDRANGERVRLAYDIASMKRQVDSNAVEPQNFFQQLELNGHETLQGPSERS